MRSADSPHLDGTDLFTGAPPRDWSAELRKLYGEQQARAVAARRRAEQQRIAGTKPSLPLAQYAGTYSDSLYGLREVTFENGALRLRTSSTTAATLEHWQYDTFRARWDKSWRGSQLVTFTIGADGLPSRLDMGGASYRRVTPASARTAGQP